MMSNPQEIRLDATLLSQVVALARQAGEKILEIYQTDFSVEFKDDQSPLTAADLASHQVIVAGLAKLTPNIPILSEESAAIDFDVRMSWNRYWILDPLDGTKEFVKKNGEFTVNIALVDGHRPVLGVVYVPVTGVVYYACEGVGAFCQRQENPPENLQCRRPAGAVPVIVGSRSHGGSSLDEALTKIGPHKMVSMGSSLKFCLVAEGKADLYPRLGLTSEWDTAAAQAVVEQAGGCVLNRETRQPLQYNTKDSLLNPYFVVIGDAEKDWGVFF